MWSPRHALILCLLGVLAVTLLFGCRAFEPETIVVNKPPETYIIGSPAEESGGYFHFHVYWYGTDDDGFVERFVWALTDTSIQDRFTDEDEEDLNFNPGTNVSTLDIGTYTTRTDSVFDFQINQGANLSYDMTLHMVAIDNRNDFDRTPARLHFFSNALGNPRVEFFRVEDGELLEFADYDTVAFGRPLFLRWGGVTPNVQAYDPVLLAERDTVPRNDPDDPDYDPDLVPDGLLGFKWRFPNEGDCNDVQEDCWAPKDFDEATGDSFSYFGDVTELNFLNDGSPGGVFGRRLGAGIVELMVNTLDVAGVQVPASNQTLHILINYEPDTYILNGEIDTYHDDPVRYPVYTVFHGPLAGTYEFTEGDTVPDGAYVTFKALGWDDPRDQILESTNLLSFQGRFEAGQYLRIDGIFYDFDSTFSDRHRTEQWTADEATGVSSDTLGFEVGPFDYDVIMRAVDEQGTSDGDPDTLSFVGNYPPCVQCIEVGRIDMEPATIYDDVVADNCYDQSCLTSPTTLSIFSPTEPRYEPTNPTHLAGRTANDIGPMHVDPSSGRIILGDGPEDWYEIFCRYYYYTVYLHGKDHPLEHWPEGEAHQRVAAWRYQIDYEADTANVIIDGGGRDEITFLTGFAVDDNNPNPLTSDLYILEDTGVWAVVVKVAVPFTLITAGDAGGPESFWSSLITGFLCPPFPTGGTNEEILAWQTEPTVQKAYRTWQLSTMQFSPGTVRAVAIDQSTPANRIFTNCYHFYDGTRIPPADPPGTRRQCEAGNNDVPADPDAPDPTGIVERGMQNLQLFAAYSNDRVPVTKPFDIRVYRPGVDQPFVGGGDPPGWISPGKSGSGGWR